MHRFQLAAQAQAAHEARVLEEQRRQASQPASGSQLVGPAGESSQIRQSKRPRIEVEESAPDVGQPEVQEMIPTSIPGVNIPRSPQPSPPPQHLVSEEELFHSVSADIPPPSPGAEARAKEAAERAQREEQENLDRYHQQHRAICNLPPPRVTERPGRRILGSEEAVHSPVFPELGPVRGRLTLPNNQRLVAEEARPRSGLLNTDSIMDRGVGAQLIYSSILPADEHMLLSGSTSDALDMAERTLVESVYRQVAATARARADRGKARERELSLVGRAQELQADNSSLSQRLDEANRRIADLERRDEVNKKNLCRIRGERESFRERLKSSEDSNERLLSDVQAAQSSRQVAVTERDKALEERCKAFEERDKVFEELSSLKAELEESREQVTNALRHVQSLNRNTLRAEAVQEYRASQAFQNEMMKYSAGFTKYGFYLARSYLEEKRPGEEFSELVYGAEVPLTYVKDWRDYGDLNPASPEDSLRVDLSELEKPSGPWTPAADPGSSSQPVDAEPGPSQPATAGSQAQPTTQPATTESGPHHPVAAESHAQPIGEEIIEALEEDEDDAPPEGEVPPSSAPDA